MFFSQDKGVHYKRVRIPCLLTFRMLLLFPLSTLWYGVIAPKACRIISLPGEEEKLFLTALLCQQKGRRKYREQHIFCDEISLSLTPNAGEWQNKERDIVCIETLQKIICWEQREQDPGSSQTGNVVTHIHQLLQSELTLKPAGEKAELGICFSLQQPWMQGFAFTRSSSWLWFCPWLTAMKGTNSAEGDPPVCKRPLLAEYTLQHCAERSKNPHQNRLSLPEKPALSRTGALMLWVSLSLILFLSCFCRQQQS